MTPPSPPRSHEMLSRWADAYGRQIGQDVARVRRWISFMALGGALERAGFSGEGPRFGIKGGVALELRLPGRARATRDLDLVLDHPDADPVEALDAVLAQVCEGFTFRRRDEPHRMPNGAVRTEVSVEYGGKVWGRVQVDLGGREGDVLEVEMVDGLDLSFFRFRFPERVPCLSIYAQAAQKIHGMTLPSRPGWRNDRFKDLVDLLLIEELIQDHAALRAACERTFALRNTHPWPPLVEIPEAWEEPFRRMAREVRLPVTELGQAVFRVRTFLNRVDARTPLFPSIRIAGDLSATTWYYAIGADDHPHRVPIGRGEALVRREPCDVPEKWFHDPGGILLLEVLVVLRSGKPAFVARAILHEIAVTEAAERITATIPPDAWERLASEILRRAKAPRRGAAVLAQFPTIDGKVSIPMLASMVGVSSREIHRQVAWSLGSGEMDSALWSFERGEMVKPGNP